MGQLLNNMSQAAKDAFENALSKTTAETDATGFLNAAGDTMTGDLTMTDATNLVLGTSTGTKIGTGNTQKLAFYNATPIARGSGLTAQLTTISSTAPGAATYTISSLVTVLPFGFATQDQGHTVLSVISNLQARVAGLEVKLQNLGLVA